MAVDDETSRTGQIDCGDRGRGDLIEEQSTRDDFDT